MATDRTDGLRFISQQGELFQGADGTGVPASPDAVRFPHHHLEPSSAEAFGATGVRVPLVAVVVDPAPGLAPAQVPADRSGPLIRTMVESEFTGEGQLDHRRRAVHVCRRRPAPEKVSSLSPTMPSSLATAEHQAPLERSHD
jgi:hypothetical protein